LSSVNPISGSSLAEAISPTSTSTLSTTSTVTRLVVRATLLNQTSNFLEAQREDAQRSSTAVVSSAQAVEEEPSPDTQADLAQAVDEAKQFLAKLAEAEELPAPGTQPAADGPRSPPVTDKGTALPAPATTSGPVTPGLLQSSFVFSAGTGMGLQQLMGEMARLDTGSLMSLLKSAWSALTALQTSAQDLPTEVPPPAAVVPAGVAMPSSDALAARREARRREDADAAALLNLQQAGMPLAAALAVQQMAQAQQPPASPFVNNPMAAAQAYTQSGLDPAGVNSTAMNYALAAMAALSVMESRSAASPLRARDKAERDGERGRSTGASEDEAFIPAANVGQRGSRGGKGGSSL
jgi:hypothetical protein